MSHKLITINLIHTMRYAVDGANLPVKKAIYHITFCAPGLKRLFQGIEDKEAFFKITDDILKVLEKEFEAL